MLLKKPFKVFAKVFLIRKKIYLVLRLVSPADEIHKGTEIVVLVILFGLSERNTHIDHYTSSYIYYERKKKHEITKKISKF